MTLLESSVLKYAFAQSTPNMNKANGIVISKEVENVHL